MYAAGAYWLCLIDGLKISPALFLQEAAKSKGAHLQLSRIFIPELWLFYSYSSVLNRSVCGRFRDSILTGMQNLGCLFKSLGSVTIHAESF